MDTKLTPRTPIENNVARWANEEAANYGSGLKGVFMDLFQGGCASGFVSHLIYYKDTIPFFRKHRKEIEAMLKEMMEESGTTSPAGLFGDKWDNGDPFARDISNQNLLAWFGFEEAARNLANRAGIEI